MYSYDFIYTPPEIIAQEVKREFDRPKATGTGVPANKKLRSKLLMVHLAVLTSPIWAGLGLLVLTKMFLGF